MTKSTGQQRLAECARLFKHGPEQQAQWKLCRLHDDLVLQAQIALDTDLRLKLRTLAADYAALRNGGATMVDFRDEPKLRAHEYHGDLVHILTRTAEIISGLPETEQGASPVKNLQVPALNLAAYASRP
jgi:hypothetical protein